MTKCPYCGEVYMTGVVGTTIMGTHNCPKKPRDVSGLYDPKEAR